MGKLGQFASNVNMMAAAIGLDIASLRTSVEQMINDAISTSNTTWSSDKISLMFNDIDNIVNGIVQNYATKQFVLDAIGDISSIRFEVVPVRPATGEPNVIYLVPSATPGQENIHIEWIWVNNQWEQIGSTEIDLSNYATLDDLDTKVDKVAGKGLSDQNFTIEEKNKLSGVAQNANNYVHPTTAGNKHLPAGGTVGNVLKNSANGTGVWGTIDKSDVGLPNVQNYSIATEPIAIEGTSNEYYMTPLRTENYTDGQVGDLDPLDIYNTNAGN